MPENLRAEVVEGFRRVRVTGIEEAGLPIVVSRTWHVMGGFFSVDIVWFVGVGAVVARCLASAEMRWVAEEEDMQILEDTAVEK